MKTALLGGSFDPVHIGHLFIAEEALVNLGFDRIVFVPAYQPPHKTERPAAGAMHRRNMLLSAIGERDDFVVDDWELRREGISYTIDTVRYVLESYDVAGRLGLIIGDDNARDFRSWREADTLLSLVEILVAGRIGADYSEVLGETHRSIDNTQLPVSSSEIRERIRSGRAYRYLVPEPVYAYVREHNLYRNERVHQGA